MDQPNLTRYRILDRIGAGGMGEAYLAENQTLGRKADALQRVGLAAGDLHRLAELGQPALAEAMPRDAGHGGAMV